MPKHEPTISLTVGKSIMNDYTTVKSLQHGWETMSAHGYQDINSEFRYSLLKNRPANQWQSAPAIYNTGFLAIGSHQNAQIDILP